MATTEPGVEIRMMTDEEWMDMVDNAARRYLGMSAEEFIRRWKAGEFAGDDRWQVMHIAMLHPLVP